MMAIRFLWHLDHQLKIKSGPAYVDLQRHLGDCCVQNCTSSAKWSENVHGYPHSAYTEDTFVFSRSLNIYFIKNSLHLYFQLRY